MSLKSQREVSVLPSANVLGLMIVFALQCDGTSSPKPVIEENKVSLEMNKIFFLFYSSNYLFTISLAFVFSLIFVIR